MTFHLLKLLVFKKTKKLRQLYITCLKVNINLFICSFSHWIAISGLEPMRWRRRN